MVAEHKPGAPGENRPHDYPSLAVVARFVATLARVPWFAALGQPLGEAERADAHAYLSALGFPEARLAPVMDWTEAGEAARNPEWNTPWWEAEEQLRAGLTARAVELIEEGELTAALRHTTHTASVCAQEAADAAARRAGVADETLVRAAAGAAVQACYQAALVLAASAEDDHAFALKYRLFEVGRWPLGILGTTFSLF